MEEEVVAVRGAIQVKKNTPTEIKSASIKLIKRLLSENSISEGDIISVIFSVTEDLNAYNPATSIREIGFERVPLMCLREAPFLDQMERVIRVLVTYRSSKKNNLRFVYLDGAEALRPDLGNGSDTDVV